MTTDVALAHDYLTQRGGAERVALELGRLFPSAPLHTSVYAPDETFPEFRNVDVRPALIDRASVLQKDHRRAFPLLAPTMASRRIDADVVIASSSGWAHGFRTTGAMAVYCHTPARWLYRTDEAIQGAGWRYRAAVRAMRPALRRWDRRAANAAEVYIANSVTTQRHVRAVYERDAMVINPPLALDPSGHASPIAGLDGCDVLVVSRLRNQKNLGLVLESARMLPAVRFVIVGSGHLESQLRTEAPPNLRLLGPATDPELRWLYRNTRLLLAPAFEDFGMTPVEAAAFGTPSVALGRGGYLETVVEEQSGLFFDRPEVGCLTPILEQALHATWDDVDVRASALPFSVERFQRDILDVVAGLSR